ncbi:hypothetical protein Q31b_42840 [Novipirellula aureliae]|uniref:Uncharacterized protein n=1 Tax=Novipirellula aureliae TaxID=2527966 RepID=A0A5C6DR67_9BACT|nr:hypothetical protein [Novipirellula aureliae]TWU37496.1 hypothetical protein Q31b_42840 [Novipirellula aureliae]
MQNPSNDPKEFLRSLEQLENQSVFTPRRSYSRDQLNEWIRAERLRQRERGEEWTAWRKFYCVEEATIPNRCHFWQPDYRDPCCTVFAIWVAYHTRRQERLYLCNGHMEQRIRDSKETAR